MNCWKMKMVSQMTIKKTFKDFVKEDLNVFFNVKELADEHELEGETVTLVLVNNRADNNMTGFSRNQLDGAQEVFKQYKTIYIKSADFYIPNIDSLITLDGIEYYVEEASEGNGVIRIVLSLNES